MIKDAEKAGAKVTVAADGSVTLHRRGRRDAAANEWDESMANIKLPHVNSFYDRHGRLRHQFRRRGYKKKLLPGLPGSAEFMDAYQLLIEQTGGGAQRVDIGADPHEAGPSMR